MVGAHSYSIAGHFEGSSVLLTGATGYVGQLVLEKLLRCTDVERVYVVLRAKRGEAIDARLEKLLTKAPVMHLLRGNPALRKVVPVAGDMTAPGLGISASDLARLRTDVDTVVHCAADIRLEAGIQDLLRANYEGTRQLLDMARSMDGLRAFVHVSSAYTNMNAPTGSLVKEAIYPLVFGDQPVDDHELVQELLSMTSHNANMRAECFMEAWGFPNPYTLSKHLTEYLVADYQRYHRLPIAIVRPTLISSVARDPYPGYTGNYAGHVGATLAFMAGLFNSPYASNYKPSNVWDAIPADIVINIIMATAAAVGARVAGSCIATPTRNGRVLPAGSEQQQQLAALAKPQHHHHGGGKLHGATARRGAAGAGGLFDVAAPGSGSDQLAAAAAAAAAPLAADHHHLHQQHLHQQQQQQQQQHQLLIVHAGTSTVYPLTILESWNYGVEIYSAWPMFPRLSVGCAAPLTIDQQVDPARAARYMGWTAWKVWAACRMLRLAGEERIARKLEVGFESFRTLNQPKTDVNLRFSTCNLRRLAALLDAGEADEFLLLWHPDAESYRMRPGLRDQRPAAAGVGVAGAAPCFGGLSAQKAAAALAAAAESPVDAAALVAAAAASRSDCGSGSVIRAGALPSSIASSSRAMSLASDADANSSDGEDGASTSSSGCLAGSSSSGGASSPAAGGRPRGARLSPEAQAAVEAMKRVPLTWRDFHINMGAFLYCSVFRMPVPERVLPIADARVFEWFKVRPEERFITHSFTLYK